MTLDSTPALTFFALIAIRKKHEIGLIKIGYFGQKIGKRKLSIGDTFYSLNNTYFSLGQSDYYYENLNKLGPDRRDFLLSKLKDIAKDSDLFDRAIKEKVTKISLFRNISPITVTGQFRRIVFGGVRLTDYQFDFSSLKTKENFSSFDMSFIVKTESSPPTNIHVLIGRNGVGKTQLINNMIDTLLNEDKASNELGRFEFEATDEGNTFANLISVSFSAFDGTEPKKEKKDKTQGIQYSYIGLKQVLVNEEKPLGPKDTEILKEDFFESLIYCQQSSKKDRWKKGIEMLESDPNFNEAEINCLIDIEDKKKFKESAFCMFNRLSSGHKIVLLTITKLIDKLQEKSLGLIDEPEAHLHPPLLSAFIRALSELLITSNGVAIIATHSPVILQEVPKSCVWKLRRTGAEAIAERLRIESFGENVGVLTNEIFGLEVANSGFYKMITKVAQEQNTYADAIQYFDGQLGMEARAILMSIFANKK